MSDFTHAPPGADTAGSDAVEEPAEAPVAERNDTRPDGGPERLAPRLGNGSERPALRLGFARGVAPSKWARRWAESGAVPLELIPLPASGRRIDGLDVVLERVAPGAQPEGTGAQPEGASAQPEGTGAQPEGTEDGGAEGNRTGNDRAEGDGAERHAVRLYSESIALVVAADHELAGEESVDLDALQLVKLLAHPDHAPQWPEPEAWKDPSWAPADAAAALELVATGLGAILLPLPLARHLSSKRAHAVLPLRTAGTSSPGTSSAGTSSAGTSTDPAVPGTVIWASWAVERDAPDVQQLIGVLRGRTACSGRPSAADADAEAEAQITAKQARARQAAKKPARKKALPKNSRGAQLAAAKAKAEAKKRAKAQEKKRKRR